MLLLVNHSTDPAFNLALEEYVLTRMSQEMILLWRNDAAVIIGRNQNAYEEVDLGFVAEHGIAVIRRLSGGGAVFHDPGNINYTVISALGKDDFGNYEKFAVPVCEFLQGLGIDARLKGRNDLVIGEAKFSGNAQAVKGGRILHHGTILFDADMSRLAGALRPSQAKIESKGIKSVRSRVTNVAEHLARPMGVEEFFERLAGFFSERTEGAYELSDADVAAVRQLVTSKYGTWEWNIGRSPAYSYRRAERFPVGGVELCLTVKDGIIRQARIFGDYFGRQETAGLEGLLIGLPHEKGAIREALAQVDLNAYIQGLGQEEFLGLF